MTEHNDQVPSPPLPLRKRYAGWRWTVAWSFVAGRVVYRLEAPAGGARLYAKIVPAGQQVTLAAEAERLRWAAAYASVPGVVDEGSSGGRDWLVTSVLPGRDATDAELRARPERLVAAFARGLRRFHDTLPVDSCPFDFRLDTAIGLVKARAAAGLINPVADFHDEHQHLMVEQAVRRLDADRPPSEDLVVCHGDYCFPNVLIESGDVTGYLDLGELGVADRWWDIAVATWSTTWNLGPGYEALFLNAYGVDADEKRMEYYRLLYDLVS